MQTSYVYDFRIQYLFNIVSWPLRLLLHFTLKLCWQQHRTAVRNWGIRVMWITVKEMLQLYFSSRRDVY